MPGSRSGFVDTEHRRAMAHTAAAVLSKLQNGSSPYWCRNEVLRSVLTDIANELRERGVLDEEECFVDATFALAKGGGAKIDPTKRGKGLKIMAIVDRHSLTLSVSTHGANHHEVRLVRAGPAVCRKVLIHGATLGLRSLLHRGATPLAPQPPLELRCDECGITS